MAKKQVSTSKSVAGAAPAPVAKPRAPRVSSAKHSKSAVTVSSVVVAEPVVTVTVSETNPHEAISKLAYGYWVARGFQGGNPHEDWVRAEREYHLAK